jgi:hypothetical protein
VAETLLQYQTALTGPNGTVYYARACGAEMPGGTWQGWIEFEPAGGGDGAVRSPRETTQPNRTDAEYWASGLTPVYLEGALRRALAPTVVTPPPPASPPIFDEPAPSPVVAEPGAPAASVLDPFSVYHKGEAMLRKQLGALSAWHLVNIIVDYELSAEDRATLERLRAAALIEVIVHGVRREVERTPIRRS